MKDKNTSFATVHDVAKLAKVSPITVSRVYNPKWEGKVKQETVDKVLKASQQLDYTPNVLAKSLNNVKSDTIAIVVGESRSIFYEAITAKLTNAIQKSGKTTLLFSVDPKKGIEQMVFEVQKHRVAAIIITASATRGHISKFNPNTRIPIVLFNRHVDQSMISAVWSDGKMAMYNMVEYCIKIGNKKNIAYITGEKGDSFESDRLEGFKMALSQYKMSPTCIKHGNFTYECGFNNTLEILLEHPETDMIVCSEDHMAIGAIDAINKKLGLRVPEDIGISGFDDDLVASFLAYDVTTVSHPVDDMIETTLDVIEKLLDNPNLQILSRFENKMIIRSSVEKG